MKVAAIHVYPVKSLAGMAVTDAQVEPWGLLHDRRWIVLEADGTVLTAREEHRMLGLTATPVDNGIQLSARDGDSLHVATPINGQLMPTALSRLDSVRFAGDEASAWLSRLIGRPVRLGWLDDPRRRSVSATHGGLEGDSLTVADAGPLLLTTTASLGQLNDWMIQDALARGAEPSERLVMARFRPNVVIDEVPGAFEEDDWRRLRIGEAEFRFAEMCDRCVMTTVDPLSLAAGKEPLRTLARHRQWDHKTWFGIRIIPTSARTIALGDPVEVLTRR